LGKERIGRAKDFLGKAEEDLGLGKERIGRAEDFLGLFFLPPDMAKEFFGLGREDSGRGNHFFGYRKEKSGKGKERNSLIERGIAAQVFVATSAKLPRLSF